MFRCDPSDLRVIEGNFKHLEGRSVPQSSDIVFIVEAKPCNEDLLAKKNIQQLLTALGKEASSSKFVNVK